MRKELVTVPLEDLTPSARIREAALRLFAEVGPRNTSLRMVAKEAGVSLGALMHYYQSKDRLEEAVQQHVMQKMRQPVAQGVSEAAPPESARAMHETYHMWIAENPVIAEYARRLQMEGSDRGMEFFRMGHEATREMLRHLVSKGGVRPFPDEEVGVILYEILEGGFLWFRPMIEATLGCSCSDPDIQARFRAAILDLLSKPLYIGA